MKKLGIILAALLAVAALPLMAQSNYHYNENMNCSDCHSMHASAHNNLTDGSAITTPNAPQSPNRAINPYYPAPNPGPGKAKLLKADDVCETCHKDQTFAPDVYGDNLNGYIRSAGGVREDATGGGHKIGSTVNPPGYDGTNTGGYFPAGSALECVSCHSPHGSANFRNLIPYAMRGAIGSANVSKVSPTVSKAAAFDSTKDVTILNGSAYTFGSGAMQNYYGRQAVVFSRLADGSEIVFNGAKSSNHMDQFCGVCHGQFHGGDATTDVVGNGTDFVRHPTSVVKVGSFSSATGASNLKLYQATGTQTAATDSPGCLTCHKAHGNNNPFGLIYPSPTAADTTEEGNGAYKTLCKSCHGMGGTITPF